MAGYALSPLSRRALFSLAAGFFAAATGSALAQGILVRAIKVRGEANRDLKMLAPVVAQHIAEQLGPRYVPGARGGATLEVNLTSIDFPVDTDGGDFFSNDVDVLAGNVRLVGPRGATITAFPLQAQTGSVNASDEYQAPTPARLNNIAHTYAYWLIGKL